MVEEGRDGRKKKERKKKGGGFLFFYRGKSKKKKASAPRVRVQKKEKLAGFGLDTKNPQVSKPPGSVSSAIRTRHDLWTCLSLYLVVDVRIRRAQVGVRLFVCDSSGPQCDDISYLRRQKKQTIDQKAIKTFMKKSGQRPIKGNWADVLKV